MPKEDGVGKKETGQTGGTAKASSSSGGSKSKVPVKFASGKYETTKKLGAGCFGEVYLAIDVDTKEEMAVKFEAVEARTQQLEQEANIMKLVKGDSATPPQGFSPCLWYGREGKYACLVMEKLGKSLEDCVQQCKGKLKPLTTALVAEQLIRRAEYLHSKGIVHRDIKPENFMWGRDNVVHHLYMIDFGLSKRYYDKDKHCAPRQGLSLTGTARYASINAHKGYEQSRRDDLEAIGHMLLYFLRGALPWSGLDAKTKEEKYRKIRQKKEDTRLEELCEGFPKEFQTFLHYARNLEFQERPDYNMMRKLFQTVRDEIGNGCEDHALQWLEDKNVNAGSLVKLNPWTPPRQPDDAQQEPPARGLCWFCKGKPPREA